MLFQTDLEKLWVKIHNCALLQDFAALYFRYITCMPLISKISAAMHLSE